MIYRTLAGERVSQLGFGAMRLPTRNGAVDEDEAIRMIRRSIDGGVNYVDTAWPYHDGLSEPLVGRALRDGYREKTFLATKSPIWLITKEGDFPDFLDRQLERLETDHIDFYLLHALNEKHWDICKKNRAVEFCERAKSEGKIRHFGFSFHDELPLFKEIIDAYDWEFCQIQYNYLDTEYQAGLEGMRYARERGADIIVMEPLRGGNLAGPLPKAVSDLWNSAPGRRSAADWAFRWIWNHPEVATVLSGMSTMEQVDEDLAIAAESSVGGLSDEDLSRVEQVEKAYRSLLQVDCTGCGYCMPCPSGVDIPRNFSVWNAYHMFEKSERSRREFDMIPEDQRAGACTECGECLSHCPQSIAIPDELKKVAAGLAS